MDIRAPKGTDDILPPESHLWRHAVTTFDNLAQRYGYGLTLTPLFEQTELFARGVGEDTEVVEKQMYTFADRKGRSLTLRPEATASVVRAYLSSGGDGVFKGSYSGPMFRYERPQKGRRRQFYQVGVEYIGEAGPFADVEVIELGYRYLQELGVPDVAVQLNSIGDAADRQTFRTVLQEWLRERQELLSPDARRRIEGNPMRVLDSKADTEVTADAPTPAEFLGSDSAAHFAVVRSGLERIGIPYVIEPRLVRGLDYYNRTVFEYVPRQYGAAQSAVGGGGRYDGLAEVLGGRPTPGVGLAMGLDRILLASDGVDLGPLLDAFIVVAEPGNTSDAVGLASRLRLEGWRIDIDPGGRSVKAQFRKADKKDARAAIVVGTEWVDNEVVVRDLARGVQEVIPVEEIGQWLTNR
ncbi:Histidyl-tRNA synthetase [hydrothermal vent metagenome]|uniref:histidine--tRNA ligase n=1 Tax=hydrothermal vent metagenome TaxID=652676 RepID=A0A3B0SQA0_9ZZZZ